MPSWLLWENGAAVVDYRDESHEEHAARQAAARAAHARRRTRREQDLGREDRTLVNPERRDVSRRDSESLAAARRETAARTAQTSREARAQKEEAESAARAANGGRPQRATRETRAARDELFATQSANPRRSAQASGARRSGQASGSTRDQRRAQAQGKAVNRTLPGSVDYNNPPSRSNGMMAPKKPSVLPKLLAVLVVVALVAAFAVFGLPVIKGVLAGDGGSQSEPAADDSLAVQDAAAEPVSFTVTFAGDCTLGTDEAFSYSSSLNAKYSEVGDPSYFMSNVYDIFSTDDLTIVNMEGTLTESTSRQDKTFAFKGPAEFTSILTSGDIEAASLANNHSKDYGESSYTDTISALDAAGILNFGYDRIAYADVKGVKVALIGTYELAIHEGIETEMVNNINAAREAGADVVLVYIHWGIEREYVPNSTQMNLGHAAIDAGADLVIGSHPHVIQGYEVYKDRYIVYSLGNFCFGGNSNPSDKDCMIFQQTFTVTNGEVAKDGQVKIIPCSISSTSSHNNYQPTPATGDEASRIMAKIEESSESIANKAANM